MYTTALFVGPAACSVPSVINYYFEIIQMKSCLVFGSLFLVLRCTEGGQEIDSCKSDSGNECEDIKSNQLKVIILHNVYFDIVCINIQIDINIESTDQWFSGITEVIYLDQNIHCHLMLLKEIYLIAPPNICIAI